MKAAPSNFYRMPFWAVHLQGFLSLLSIFLILIRLSNASSVFQSVSTMDALTCGIWAVLITNIAITNWAPSIIPLNAVSKTEGGTL